MNPTVQYPMFFDEAHRATYERAQEVAFQRIRPMEEQDEAPNEDMQARAFAGVIGEAGLA